MEDPIVEGMKSQLEVIDTNIKQAERLVQIAQDAGQDVSVLRQQLMEMNNEKNRWVQSIQANEVK